MIGYRRITISGLFFFLTMPAIATAIPITYQFDALDWYNPSQIFSGTITFESSTLGVLSDPSSNPSYPGFFVYEDAIISTTITFGATTMTQLGGSIYNNCVHDPYFSIISPVPFFDLTMPSCLPGADQADLSAFDLTVLNSVIFYGDPALSHRGPPGNYSGTATPYNFRLVMPVSVPEPPVLMLIIFGIAAMGFVRRKGWSNRTLSLNSV